MIHPWQNMLLVRGHVNCGDYVISQDECWAIRNSGGRDT